MKVTIRKKIDNPIAKKAMQKAGIFALFSVVTGKIIGVKKGKLKIIDKNGNISFHDAKDCELDFEQ